MDVWPWLVDLLILGLLAFSGWRGWRDGLLAASANLLGLVLSLWLAFQLYPWAASLLLQFWSLPEGLANIFAFLLLAFVIDGFVTGLVLMGSAHVARKWWGQTWWHASAVLPGVINGLITVSYLASLVLALPLQHPIKTALQSSLLAPPLSQAVTRLGVPVSSLVQPALNDLSQLLTVDPGSDEFVTLPFRSDNPQLCAQAEEQMLALVNQERTSRGVGALVMNDALRQLARSYSLDMYRRGYFSHYTPEGQDPFDRMEEAQISYQAAGENLALAPTLETAHEGLMNSPGHRRNILDSKFQQVGIGCYQDPRYGMMFSQEFTN